MQNWFRYGWLLAVASCTSGGDHSIAVGQNSLGITTLQVDRYGQAGESIIEVRGEDASGRDVVTYRSRYGYMPELPALPDTTIDTHRGKEITISVAGAEPLHVTNRSPDVTDLAPEMMSPSATAFLRLPEVAKLLAHDITLVTASSEVPYGTGPCGPSNMRNNVGANGCCQWNSGVSNYYTMHIPSNNLSMASYRVFNADIGECRTSTGGLCTGTGCTYGPCGAKNPSLYSPGAYAKVISNGTSCSWYAATGPGQSTYGNTSGSCGYTGCNNGTPVTGGAGTGWWE